jgi:antitoxin Phd
LARRIRYDYYGHICEGRMREIQLRDAKATLSSVVDDAARGEPSIITRHGRPEAVVIGFDDWKRLSSVPSFGRLLMSAPIQADDLPERDRSPIREIKL